MHAHDVLLPQLRASAGGAAAVRTGAGSRASMLRWASGWGRRPPPPGLPPGSDQSWWAGRAAGWARPSAATVALPSPRRAGAPLRTCGGKPGMSGVV